MITNIKIHQLSNYSPAEQIVGIVQLNHLWKGEGTMECDIGKLFGVWCLCRMSQRTWVGAGPGMLSVRWAGDQTAELSWALAETVAGLHRASAWTVTGRLRAMRCLPTLFRSRGRISKVTGRDGEGLGLWPASFPPSSHLPLRHEPVSVEFPRNLCKTA